MADVLGSAVAAPPASEADMRPTLDPWSEHHVDKHVMGRLKPKEPLISVDSSVVALGSGLSAMLRGRTFAKSAKVLPERKFGAVLPMKDWPPLPPHLALEHLEWVFRGRSNALAPENPESERVRRRAKRMLQTTNVLIITFGLGRYSDDADGRATFPNATDVLRDLRKLYLSIRRFAADARVVLALDPTPISGPAGGGIDIPANVGGQAALRAGLGEFLAMEKADFNQNLFYFPAFELEGECVTAGLMDRAIVDVFRAYYTNTGPTIAEAGRGFATARLRKSSSARRDRARARS